MRYLDGRYRWILIVITIGVVALFLFMYLVFASPSLDRSDCGEVVQAFGLSLMHNKIEVAKSLTPASEWNRIDAWMTSHEEGFCSFSLDPDDTQAHIVCSPCRDRESALSCCEFSFSCTYDDGVYRLSIDDIILEKLGEDCVVESWGEVCENRGANLSNCD